MPQKTPRLSAVLATFVAAVLAVGGNLSGAVVEAVAGSIGAAKEGTARVLKGATFVNRPVNLGALASGLTQATAGKLPGADVREVIDAIMTDAQKRGQAWRDQCLALAIEEHLISPLMKAGGVVAEAGPPSPRSGKTKGKA